MIKILLATDSDILRPRLRTIISEIPRLTVVCEIADEHDIIGELQLTQPDILVMFFPRLGQSAARLVPIVRRAHPGIVVIALTTDFGEINEESWKRAGSTYIFNLTLHFQQFIDCLATYARAESFPGRRTTGEKALDNNLSKENI